MNLPTDVAPSKPVQWTPPGKGAWELDTAHFGHPCTPLFQEIFPAGMIPGFKAAAEQYGAFLSHIDYDFVNGFAYGRTRPAAAPEDAAAKNPPPAFVMKLYAAVHPELRKRTRNAERLWKERTWRQQLAEWQQEKPILIQSHIELQNTDLAALDDRALWVHLTRVCEHARVSVERHHIYTLPASVPSGDLLAHVNRWSGGTVSDSDVLALLAGTSQVSADLRSPDALRFGEIARDNPQARALLRLDEPAASISPTKAGEALAALRAADGELGERTAEFLTLREYWLLEGIEPGAPCLHESPDVLWRGLRTAALTPAAPEGDTADGPTLDRVRAAIPEENHREFDDLLGEARSTYGLRDERALYTDVWAWGIVRSTILHIGARLIERDPSLLFDPEDLVYATRDEIRSLLLNSDGPTAAELQARHAYRDASTTRDAPPHVGMTPKPPPPSDRFPPPVARLTEAIGAVLRHAFGLAEVEAEAADGELAGHPASAGTHEGIAHVINDLDDVNTMPDNAVIVIAAGSSSFTMVAPLASAVVAEGGGILSHVAIVCREYGIPSVCGCSGALRTITTGDRVLVDGDRGIVGILERADAT